MVCLVNTLQALVATASLARTASFSAISSRGVGSHHKLYAGFGGPSTSSSAQKSKPKNNKRTSKKKKASNSASSFDAGASLIRLEKKYEELMADHWKRLLDDDDNSHLSTSEDEKLATEHVIAMKSSNTEGSSTSSLISDWVPVAQIVLVQNRHSRLFESDEKVYLRAAVSLFCRELAQAAIIGSRVFANVPRNQLQYSAETVDSFHTHVYENVLEDSSSKKGDNDQTMSNAEARRVLGLEGDDLAQLDKSALKRIYFTHSMTYHPDRVIGLPQEERDEAALNYARIKLAYETLMASGTVLNRRPSVGGGGGKESWYETLGGKERIDFWKLDGNLLPISAAQQTLRSGQVESAVVTLDPYLVQGFVARCCAR